MKSSVAEAKFFSRYLLSQVMAEKKTQKTTTKNLNLALFLIHFFRICLNALIWLNIFFFTKQEGNKELVMEGTGSFNSSGNYAK